MLFVFYVNDAVYRNNRLHAQLSFFERQVFWEKFQSFLRNIGLEVFLMNIIISLSIIGIAIRGSNDTPRPFVEESEVRKSGNPMRLVDCYSDDSTNWMRGIALAQEVKREVLEDLHNHGFGLEPQGHQYWSQYPFKLMELGLQVLCMTACLYYSTSLQMIE